MDWIWKVQCEENDSIFLLELWKSKDSTSLKQSVQGQGTERANTEWEEADEGGL